MTTFNQTAFRVAVLCTGNSARSQIAEALITTRGAHRAAGAVLAVSAGSYPARQVNPLAIEVLAEHGIAWSNRTPRPIGGIADQHFNLVITVCDNARDACPFFPGASVQVHWGLPDPADVAGISAARAAFHQSYNALSGRVDALLALPLESLSSSELNAAVAAIHVQQAP